MKVKTIRHLAFFLQALFYCFVIVLCGLGLGLGSDSLQHMIIYISVAAFSFAGMLMIREAEKDNE